jgi:hypothetical protein
MILSYRVLTTEAHAGTDWNLILMTEYKDLAALEANEDKEVLGGRLAREIVLEPRP